MKRTQAIFISLFTLLFIFTSGCGLTTDLEDLRTPELPNLENTGGTEGGTGGENPPPDGK